MAKILQNREAILADYLADVKVEVIAMVHGCDKSTPSSIAKAMGYPTRTKRSQTLYKEVAATAKAFGVDFARELHKVSLSYVYRCMKKAAG